MQIKFHPIPTKHARALQNGGLDANGQPAEHSISRGQGNPCRHCLNDIPKGAEMLILAYRPFPSAQPYAEIGPIFLCGEECAAHNIKATPKVLKTRESYLVKGYGEDNRIVYGTGKIVPMAKLPALSREILNLETVEYIHVRSASNNCFQCKIT